MHKMWKRYVKLLSNDLNAQIFDNIKNLLVCAFLFAVGTAALHGDHHVFMGLFASNLAGWGLIAVSVLLTLLNVSDGLNKLAGLRYHATLQVIVCLVYVIFALRVVEVVWDFRLD
ncbi:hypothetical protein JFU37_07415 [Pseudomonas sp. TH41]|uniref:hypothetical protein n=1 Tax=Pseudomonas sp. TH41 TaxID=2796405 RepID=UPI00191277EB|nr:hypothetical protein [Pseudomonas sp. TH41]MBK5352336.1 hypothetical protein [Pseudomonas sp. TH41]